MRKRGLSNLLRSGLSVEKKNGHQNKPPARKKKKKKKKTRKEAKKKRKEKKKKKKTKKKREEKEGKKKKINQPSLGRRLDKKPGTNDRLHAKLKFFLSELEFSYRDKTETRKSRFLLTFRGSLFRRRRPGKHIPAFLQSMKGLDLLP